MTEHPPETAAAPGKEYVSVDVDKVDLEVKAGTGAKAAVGGGSKTSRLALLAIVAFLVIAIGVGVGVGVGVGTKKKKSSSGSSVDEEQAATFSQTYYVAADQIMWNYAPSGRNMCFDNRTAAMLLTPGTTRVGGTFTKAQYREYTDASFKTLKTRPAEWEHLGNLGPVMFGAVGDVLRIHFKNNLPFAVNMVPSGGLVAWDSSSNSNSNPSGSILKSARMGSVAPGSSVTYYWRVTKVAGPADGASVTSRLWLYRSTVDPVAHDNAGLVGAVIVTSAAAAGADRRARDVDRELVIMFQVVSEMGSAMLPYDTDPSLTSGVSYTKMAINGYTYCNMPLSAVTLRVGQRVRWHVASVGSSDSLHNYHWHGHGLELNGHHVDQFTAIPGASYSGNMAPDQPGNWMFHCHVNYHMDGGMANLYRVEGDPAPLPAIAGGREWVHYVAAEETEWRYTGENNSYNCGPEPIPYGSEVTDTSPPGNVYVVGPSTSPVRLGPVYTKTVFREYLDANFTQRKERSEQDSYLGLVGPILRAAVGDNITVVLLNRASMAVSMHPHGLRYDKANEGTLYEDGTTAAEKLDDVVQPGQNFTYRWMVPDRAGPGPKDPSSLLWMYHSHLNETAQTYAGLMGGIIVTARDKVVSAADPRPTDVDREVVIYFNVVNETKSSNLMYNLATKLGDGGALAARMATNSTLMKELIVNGDFDEHMLKHGINGYMYCNMPPLNFLQGDKVRLHVMVLGSVEDMHTPNLGGPRFDYNNQNTDSIQISPGGMVSADVAMTAPGDYELQCRVADHVMSGMRAKYRVAPNPAAAATRLSGATRTHFVQAEAAEWDYAPQGYQRCTDMDMSYYSNAFLLSSYDTSDSKYRKAVYREYTDATFTVRKSTPAYYGIMGPLLTVEVGDILEVYFRNALSDLPDYPVNLSPGGGLVRLTANDTQYGNFSTYISSSSLTDCGEEVEAGQTCVYQWIVPESAGPAAADFNTAVYGYTSTVDVATSPSAGLVGALVVADRGALRAANASSAGSALLPQGVDLMVPLYWQIMNEEVSPYYDVNMAADGINMTLVESEEAFAAALTESNSMHAINGYVYCNMPKVTVKSGAVVRWVMVAYGTEGDFHAPYFAGQAVQVDRIGYSTLASLMPSIARVADMTAGDPGTWQLYCDIHDHFLSGMIAEFVVQA